MAESFGASRAIKVGYLGMGVMGTEMTLNLLKASFDVYVWNRSIAKCLHVVKAGAKKCDSMQDVFQKCDVILCCLSDDAAYEDAILKNLNVLACIGSQKGIVNFSSISPNMSYRLAKEVHDRQGTYLEAPVDGSKLQAAAGNLVIMAAGDKELYEQTQPVFKVIGKQAYFLGNVGNGLKMKLATSTLKVITYCAFMESISLAENIGLHKEDFIEIVEQGVAGCTMFSTAGRNIIEDKAYGAALKYPLENTRLTVAMTDNSSLVMAKAAMDLLQQASTNGSEDSDVSTLYHVIKKEPKT